MATTINPSKNPFLEGEASSVSAAPPRPVTLPPRTPPPNAPVQSETVISPAFSPSPKVAPQALAPPKNRRLWRPILVVLAILLIAVGVFSWWRTRETALPEVEAPTPAPTPVFKRPIETPVPVPESEAPYASENFKAGEIVIGGELEFLQGEDAVTPLAISNIRGEAFTEKNKQEVKLVVTWETNRLALSTIEYAKGVGQAEKSITENDYSYSHSLILAGLDPASTYLYTIKSEDRFGNVVESEPHAVFTGARTVSLFDLIAGAIGDVFGWAVDK